MARQLIPGRPAEIGAPVCRQFSVLPFFADVEEVAVPAVRILAGLPEPFVLIGTMVDDQVHQDIHISLLCLCDQFLHIFHGPEARINPIVIGNVIALVRQRGFIDRRQPDDVDSEVLQVIELRRHALYIPDPVSVYIIKALRINLVYYFIMPPFAFHFPSSGYHISPVKLSAVSAAKSHSLFPH